jgi:hypothetical protein
MGLKTSILGTSKVSKISCDGPIKRLIAKKYSKLSRHPQLINKKTQ